MSRMKTKFWLSLVVVLMMMVGSNLAALAEGDDDLKFEQVMSIKDAGNGETLKRPMSVVVDSKGRIIVNDLSDRIFIYDKDGKLVKSFGKRGKKDGQFKDTFGLAVDSKDRIYVSDTGNYRVQVFDPEGNFVSAFGKKGAGDGELARPGSMVVYKDRIYVIDIENHRVSAWDLNGKWLFHAGSQGSAKGKMSYPQGITFDASGTMYVVDSLNFRISKFADDGEFDSVFGKQGDTEGTFSRPKGIAVDGEDNVFIVDGLLNLVQVVDTEGEYLGKIGGDSEQALFSQPYGIYFSNGRIFVADRGNDEIKVFVPKK